LPYLKYAFVLHIYLLEASYVLLACKYDMMAPANRKQLLAAVFICAAVFLVQKFLPQSFPSFSCDCLFIHKHSFCSHSRFGGSSPAAEEEGKEGQTGGQHAA
jgi:hypothetical protein